MHEGGEREQAVSEAVQRGSSALRVLQGRTRAG
jgi:hypothetical protein